MGRTEKVSDGKRPNSTGQGMTGKIGAEQNKIKQYKTCRTEQNKNKQE
jgi:hypothetical protein